MSSTAEDDAQRLHLRAVVAIPARNEEAHLAACLGALAAQTNSHGHPLPPGMFGALLLLNNCTDRSHEIAAEMARVLPFPFCIFQRQLPPLLSHAGGARRMAMDLAAKWLGEGRGRSVLLTTDADSRVATTWIAENLAAIDAGAEAVTGDIALDAADEARLPELIRARGFLEATYGRQLTELASLIDPEPHNPWPHHRTTSGASLAITLGAYRQVGGLPALPVGEDSALIAALKQDDARVRFAPNVQVITSGRLVGRAIGGTADTMRRRSEDPTAPCDDALEPVGAAILRASWRSRLRRLHRERRLADPAWAKPLGLTRVQAMEIASLRTFGAIWNQIEKTSPAFKTRPLTPCELVPQIRRADQVLAQLRRQSAPRGEIEAKFTAAIAADDGHDTLQIF